MKLNLTNSRITNQSKASDGGFDLNFRWEYETGKQPESVIVTGTNNETGTSVELHCHMHGEHTVIVRECNAAAYPHGLVKNILAEVDKIFTAAE